MTTQYYQQRRDAILDNMGYTKNTDCRRLAKQAIDTLFLELVGEDAVLITPKKYEELYPRRSFKADASVHYENKAIVAKNNLRRELRSVIKGSSDKIKSEE